MRTLLLALLPFASACTAGDEILYVGTYTGADTGSRGIYRYRLSPEGQLSDLGLDVESDNPSFLTLTPDGRTLLAVNETEAGSLQSFRLGKARLDSGAQTLTLVSTSSSGGAHPCHVAVDAAGRVLVANYTGGNVGYLRVGVDAQLTQLLDVLGHSGDAGEVPHAHSVYFDPAREQSLSVDLGTGDLFAMRLVDWGERIPRPATPARLRLDSAAGPRHLAFHPNGRFAYVVNEFANTVTLLTRETPGGTLLSQSFGFAKQASYPTRSEGFDGESYASHVAVSRDGRFLYAANRGADAIAAFAVDGVTGGLTLVDEEPVRGDWPRHFALSGDEDFLVVANQRSSNLTVLRRDREDGTLSFASEAAAPTPA